MVSDDLFLGADKITIFAFQLIFFLSIFPSCTEATCTSWLDFEEKVHIQQRQKDFYVVALPCVRYNRVLLEPRGHRRRDGTKES